MARKAQSRYLDTKGTDDDGKTIYVANADTRLASQHEMLIGSRKLNQYTGDTLDQNTKTYRFAHPVYWGFAKLV